MADTERQRLPEADTGRVDWRHWGPYLSERQWGTVREDYGEGHDTSFTHDQARYRAYRWGEDGLVGISDDRQRLCLALTLWNGVDPGEALALHWSDVCLSDRVLFVRYTLSNVDI